MQLFSKEIRYEEENREEIVKYELDNIDESEFYNKDIEHIKEEYYIRHHFEELPTILFNEPYLNEEPNFGREMTSFNAYIPLVGKNISLMYKPSSQYLWCFQYNATISEPENAICFPINIKNSNSFDIDDLIEKTITDRRKNIETQYEYLKKDISLYNSKLKNFIDEEIDKLHSKLKLKNELQEKSKKSKYLKIIPKDISPIKIVENKIETINDGKVANPTIKSVQTMILEEKSYIQIIDTLNELSIYSNRLPKSYFKLEEQDIRDQIINSLNLKLKTATASGETFNAKGKTDIIIIDNKKIYFIAECKIWKGNKLFKEAIDQLLSYISEEVRYSSLIIFNKNKCKVDADAIDSIKSHRLYLKEINNKRYKFKHPKNEILELEVSLIIFNVG